ncbi:hypothetical protein [Bradyrhizobium neotropicale]|nr:hypothetical protein [Bradyrhizobium neotropicale]
MDALDRLEALLSKVGPFVERFGEDETSELLRYEIANAKVGLHTARRNAMLLEGILPV